MQLRYSFLEPLFRLCILSCGVLVAFLMVAAPKGPEGYVVETVDIPDEITLGVGGLAFHPSGALFITTREGQVWRLKGQIGSFLPMGFMKSSGFTLIPSARISGSCNVRS